MGIAFTCSHCGKAMVVEDHFAGQTGPCAGCGRSIAIPVPAGAPGTSVSPGAVGVLGIILGIGGAILLICVGLAGGMYALWIPGVGSARVAADRSSSMNNLKQISMALQSYHDDHGSYPPAYVTDSSGKPLYSWRVLILPYLQQQALYNRFDKTRSWDDPVNLPVSNTMVRVFRSPADSNLATNGTSYVCIVGKNSLFSPGTGRTIDLEDESLAQTIAVLEIKGIEGSWAAPIDPHLDKLASQILGLDEDQLHPAQPEDGVLVLFGDGNVRYLEAIEATSVIQPAAVTLSDSESTTPE